MSLTEQSCPVNSGIRAGISVMNRRDAEVYQSVVSEDPFPGDGKFVRAGFGKSDNQPEAHPSSALVVKSAWGSITRIDLLKGVLASVVRSDD